MDNDDKIIIDLKKDNPAKPSSSDKSSSADKVDPKLRTKIIKELRDYQKQEDEDTKTENKEKSEENIREQKYQDFLDRYEVKPQDIVAKPIARYNSELDFQVNRKIKKVRYPKTKTQKLIITIAVCVCVILATLGLIFALQDHTPPVELAKVTLSQPIKNNVYQVNNVYVNDELNYKNIYLICEYSDGSIQKKELTRNMLSTSSSKFDNQSNKFVESGNVEFNVNYQGQNLKLNYVVEDYTLESISCFAPQMHETYNILATTQTLDISKSIILTATYSNGRTAIIDLASCTYNHAGISQPATLTDGKIDISTLDNDKTYAITISYTEGEVTKDTQFIIKCNFES